MEARERVPWWRGARGEWWVVGQVFILALVFFGPRRWGPWSGGPFPLPGLCAVIGIVLMIAGMALLLAGALCLGAPNLTPLPCPRERGTLVRSGVYAIARHPMYGGGVMLAFGWALYAQSWLTFGYAVLLLAFADVKSRREERWLTQKFPDYPDYRRRVRRFVPFVY